jgi:hypothetical protein
VIARATWLDVLGESTAPQSKVAVAQEARIPLSYVRAGKLPPKLRRAEVATLSGATDKSGDERFVMALRLAIDMFLFQRKEFERLTDRAIKLRMSRVDQAGRDFLKAVTALELNERVLIGNEVTACWLAGHPSVDEGPVLRAVERYLEHVAASMAMVKKAAIRPGRRQDLAARGLAFEVLCAMVMRDGKVPPVTRKKKPAGKGGHFERVLLWCLDTATARTRGSREKRRSSWRSRVSNGRAKSRKQELEIIPRANFRRLRNDWKSPRCL